MVMQDIDFRSIILNTLGLPSPAALELGWVSWGSSSLWTLATTTLDLFVEVHLNSSALTTEKAI